MSRSSDGRSGDGRPGDGRTAPFARPGAGSGPPTGPASGGHGMQRPGVHQHYRQPAHADPVTGPPTGEPTRPQTRLELGPATRATPVAGQPSAREQQYGATPIVPPASVTGSSLTLVITIMCFLACLTAGAVHLMNQSAQAWHREIASEVTVQVEPRERVDTEKVLVEVQAFVSRQAGVRSARTLTLADSSALLEPWLGQSEALKSLPVPRLIAVEIDRTTPADLDGLRALLAKQFKGVSLDDHRHWQHQIRAVTRTFALGGLAILLLVGAATTAIIVSATRSAMASNREIVEVLHFVGATDRFIAREFSKHFLRLGVRAGIVGAVSALLVFLALPSIMEVLGGGGINMADMRRLIGSGSLDVAGYILLAIFVVVIAALCMLTSRFGVYRILDSRQ